MGVFPQPLKPGLISEAEAEAAATAKAAATAAAAATATAAAKANAGVLPAPASKLAGDPVRCAQNDSPRGGVEFRMTVLRVGSSSE